MENKLYIEYRLHFNPKASQESLHELAKLFQEHIYDLWNNDNEHGADLDVVDVSYDVILEVEKK